MKNQILFILFVTLSLILSAQKIEKETRIESEKVPQKALEFVFNSTESSKVNWYYEVNEKGNSYEAEFKIKKSKISVEFDLKGNLQDVEIEISKSKIPSAVKKSLKKYFKIYFKKYRILTVQKQYTGDLDILQNQLKDTSILTQVPTLFEIVVIGKKTDNVTSTEFQFDISGNLISSKKVILKNSDNLTY